MNPPFRESKRQKQENRQRQGISSQDILRATTSTLPSQSSSVVAVQLSNGALEGLRMCHEAFLSLVASELAAQHERNEEASSKTSTAAQTPQHVVSCLERLNILSQGKLQQLLQQNQSLRVEKAVPGRKSKKRKHPAVTQEMLDEQERLLARSRQQALLRQGKTEEAKVATR